MVRRAAAAAEPASLQQASERRSEILAIAASCFAEMGYRASSMRTIAKACGLLPGSLYSHFESKLQMLDELLTSFFDELIPRQRVAYDSEGTVAERFTRMIDEVICVCDQRREALMVIELDWHEIVNTPDLAHLVELGRETSMLFRRLLEEGVRSGEVRDDVDLDSLVRLIYSSIYGLLDRRFRQSGKAGRRINNFTAAQASSTIRALFFGGILR